MNELKAQRNVRVATQAGHARRKVHSVRQLRGDVAGEAGRDPSEVADPLRFKPTRKPDPSLYFSFGKHQCFGSHIVGACLHGMVKLAAGLKSLRPGPDEMGVIKALRVGSEKAYLNGSWCCLTFDASTFKVFDGYGQDAFQGNRAPTEVMGMQ